MRRLTFLRAVACLLLGVAVADAMHHGLALRLVKAQIAEAAVREEISRREPALAWMPAGTLPDRRHDAWHLSPGVPFDADLDAHGIGGCDMLFYPDGLLAELSFIFWSYRGCPLLIQRQRVIEAYGDEDGNALFDALLAEMEI